MSYPPYTPPGNQAPQAPPTYPYGTYHPPPHSAYGHLQTPGTYPSPYTTPGAYQAGVTGYGWTYPYSYVPSHPQSASQSSRPPVQTSVAGTTQSTTFNSTTVPQRSTTFTSYTPSYMRESVAAAATGGATGRGPRRQSNIKGVFAKELRSLMYGFGDDRNPANDTVNVMEEILLEYLTDVCQTAGAISRKTRLSIEDLRRALSRPADAKKLARMEELLFLQEDIKRARAEFDSPRVLAES